MAVSHQISRGIVDCNNEFGDRKQGTYAYYSQISFSDISVRVKIDKLNKKIYFNAEYGGGSGKLSSISTVNNVVGSYGDGPCDWKETITDETISPGSFSLVFNDFPINECVAPEPTPTPEPTPSTCSCDSGFILMAQSCSSDCPPNPGYPTDPIFKGTIKSKNKFDPGKEAYVSHLVFNFDYNGVDLTFQFSLNKDYVNNEYHNPTTGKVEKKAGAFPKLYGEIMGKNDNITMKSDLVRGNLIRTSKNINPGKENVDKDYIALDNWSTNISSSFPDIPGHFKEQGAEYSAKIMEEAQKFGDLVPIEKYVPSLGRKLTFKETTIVSSNLKPVYDKLVNKKGNVIPNKSTILEITVTNTEVLKYNLSLDPLNKQGNFYKWNIKPVN